jgi:hypothetical protein
VNGVSYAPNHADARQSYVEPNVSPDTTSGLVVVSTDVTGVRVPFRRRSTVYFVTPDVPLGGDNATDAAVPFVDGVTTRPGAVVGSRVTVRVADHTPYPAEFVDATRE